VITRHSQDGRSGAAFSDDEQYRYLLWRMFSDVPRGEARMLCWTMLNPSSADHEKNDPTVERCEKRARRWGYNGLYVVNLFPLRSTDPRALRKHSAPRGSPYGTKVIIEAALGSKMTICAWGGHGSFLGRGEEVLEQLRFHGIKLYALKVNSKGVPAHPLYLGYALEPIPFGRVA
jgi:hypothetical protein